jgi:hypothetical protein
MLLGKAGFWSQVELQDLKDIQDYPTKTGLVTKVGTFENIRLVFQPTQYEPYQYDCLGHPTLPCTMVCPWIPTQPYILNARCKHEKAME